MQTPAQERARLPWQCRIALAQLTGTDGDIAANLALHRQALDAAAAEGADLVVFPELSLTGYVLDQAAFLAQAENSVWIEMLRQAARDAHCGLIAGLPLANAEGRPSIGTLICDAAGQVRFYRKQVLHPGEEHYIAAGESTPLLSLHGARIALAICADSSDPAHGAAAARAGADLYLASVLISPAGLAVDRSALERLARQHRMPVLMANHCGMTGGWQGAGSSGFWNAQGEPEVALADQPGLLVLDLEQGRLCGYRQIPL